jgi:hypothetical protein
MRSGCIQAHLQNIGQALNVFALNQQCRHSRFRCGESVTTLKQYFVAGWFRVRVTHKDDARRSRVRDAGWTRTERCDEVAAYLLPSNLCQLLSRKTVGPGQCRLDRGIRRIGWPVTSADGALAIGDMDRQSIRVDRC